MKSKAIVLLCMSALFCLALSGCASGDEASSSDSNSQDAASVDNQPENSGSLSNEIAGDGRLTDEELEEIAVQSLYSQLIGFEKKYSRFDTESCRYEIKPEKSRLDYIVVHDKNEATQVQVRGRYRGDIETVYYRKEPEDGLGKIPEDVIAPYLGRRLSADDKKRLCGERGRTLGWRTVKPLLEAQGYEVLEKKSGGMRYTIISIGE